jgi:hypothetical protein
MGSRCDAHILRVDGVGGAQALNQQRRAHLYSKQQADNSGTRLVG